MTRQLFAILAASVAIAFVPAMAHADLIAEYKFDGGTSDATGNGNDGTASGGAAYAGDGSGIAGGAYEFSGAGHVVVPIDINPSVIPNLSVTMWVKPNEDIPGVPGLYKTFGHDDGGWDRTFGLDNREGEYRYAAFTGGARPGPTPTTGTEIEDEWTFLAAVWDSDAGPTVRFHAGENMVTEALTNTPSGHVTTSIGNLRPDNFNEGWQGLIDEVQIHDRALSVDEIDAIRLSVPEPGSLTLLLLGGLGLAAVARRRCTRC